VKRVLAMVRMVVGLLVVLMLIVILLSSHVFPDSVVWATEKPVPKVIGNGSFGFQDGSFENAAFRFPYGIVYEPLTGTLLVSDQQNHRIRRINPSTGQVTTIAGTVEQQDRFGFPAGGHRDGDTSQALFNHPRGIAVSDSGVIFVADTGNHMIRMIHSGSVFTIAGNGEPGYQNGKGIEARFHSPTDIVLDAEGNLYVSDTLNNSIRKIDEEGNVTTLEGESGEGSAFLEPKGLYLGENNRLFVADSAHHQIKLLEKGTVSLLAGVPGTPDEDTPYQLSELVDGNVSKAKLNFPIGITSGTAGSLLIADAWNHSIRMLSPEGEVVTLAGAPFRGYELDESHIVLFDIPTDLVVVDGHLYVTDQRNNRIVFISLEDLIKTSADSQKLMLETKSEVPLVYLNEIQVRFLDVQPLFVNGGL